MTAATSDPPGAGRWRATSLLLVHLVIALHVAHWISTGSTLTPVEPSQAMQTLGSEALLNAGFLFFILLILSTLILGRFFCGWACHVVALQDLCTWILRKLGLRPKPFRSRLLMFVPLLAAFYLFVMPTLVRLYLGDTRIAPQDSECSICTAPPGATRMPGAWKRNCKRVLNPRRSLAVRWDLRVRWTAMEREHS